MLSKFRERVTSFAREEGGNIAVVGAFAVGGLLLAGGMAVDLSRISNVRATAQNALDSATLATLRAVRNGEVKPNDADMKTSVEKFFVANGAGGGFMSQYELKKLTLAFDKSSLTADASLEVPMAFMAIAGHKVSNVTLSSKVGYGMPDVDIDILLDKSLTMRLPSDPKVQVPITKVYYEEYKKTVNCAFACHDDGSVARAKGVEIKIDTVAGMVQDFMTKLSDANWSGKIMLHSFYGAAKLEVGPTSNPKDVSTFFKTPVSLKGSDEADESTDLDLALTSASTDTSKLTAKDKAVLLITDGQHMRATKAYTGAGCKKLKDQGFKVYVIHVTFDPASLAVDGMQDPDGTKIPLSDIIKRNTNGGKVTDYSGYYMGYFSGTKNNVDNMKKCSSGEGYYYSGTTGTEIAVAFESFLKSLSGAKMRLLN